MSNQTCPPPPPVPSTCPQVCAPPPPLPPCRAKPIMRGLHWAQTERILAQAIISSIIGGGLFWYYVAYKRKKVYAEFYQKSQLDDWAEDMAKKGLFQSTPKETLQDFKKP